MSGRCVGKVTDKDLVFYFYVSRVGEQTIWIG